MILKNVIQNALKSFVLVYLLFERDTFDRIEPRENFLVNLIEKAKINFFLQNIYFFTFKSIAELHL